jgi:spermidine/putrescine transport system substrate-binding protein
MAQFEHPRQMSRRSFMKRAGGTAIALPSMAAILAACSKPGSGPSGSGASATEIPIATLDNPVTLPFNADPIPASTPIESGPLVYYNWADYIYKKEIQAFEDKFGVEVKLTTYNNMEEGIAKVQSGQVKPDVFFVTKGYLRRLVQNDLLQPLQQELVPNISNMWPIYSDPGPYYDVGWRYTVPYTIYTWGVAYRRDRIDDPQAAEEGWEALWNSAYEGAISLYNSYGDTIAVAILRSGSLDVNTQDPQLIDDAKNAILETIDQNKAKLTINGVYDRLPAGDFTVAESWSGDIVGAQWYLPKGVDWDILGYWRPDPGKSMTDNDLIAIPTGATNPRLAHEFINFFLDEKVAYDNFRWWNGYQPPLKSIDPERLIDDHVVPPNLPMAVVTEEMFKQDLTPYELPPEVDQLWQAAWTEITAGAGA